MVGIALRVLAVQIAAHHLQVADALEFGQVGTDRLVQHAGVELALVQFDLQLLERLALVGPVGVVDEVLRMVELSLTGFPGAILAEGGFPVLVG
ncbi:hypothetical protein D3C77_536860 [compost metagenome]